MRHSSCSLVSLVSLLALAALSVQAATRTWDGGAADGDWFNPVNWDGDATAPGAGDVVGIGGVGGGVTVTGQTAWLASLEITNNTLTFSDTTNLEAELCVTNVFLRNLATLTHDVNSATDTNAAGLWLPDGRVFITCSNITLDAGAKIDVNEKGYDSEKGPGAGKYGTGGWYGGGGYGGQGGQGANIAGSQGTTYGPATAPAGPGSAGGKIHAIPASAGGEGGGWVRIAASGHVAVSGTISANGRSVSGGAGNGAGSGGAIYITCHTFGGSNGVVTANGGHHGLTSSTASAGGGGGRIAVVYDASAQSNLTVKPTGMTIGANQGHATQDREVPGTISMPDEQLLAPTKMQGGQFLIPGFTSWTVGDFGLTGGQLILTNVFLLTVTNDFTISGYGEVDFTNGLALGGLLNVNGGLLSISGGLSVAYHDLTVAGTLRLALTNESFEVPGNLTVNAGGNMELVRFADQSPDLEVVSNLVVNGGTLSYYGRLNNGATLSVGKELTVTNGGDLYVYSGMTNAATGLTGLLVNVAGDINIATNSWLHPVSHRVNGGSAVFRPQNLRVPTANCGFDANEGGFGALKPTGYGPGGGTCVAGGWAGGGGHGGAGADGSDGVGGVTNDSVTTPSLPGSGAGRTDNFGGGLVRVHARDTIDLNGSILADGIDFPAADGSGGGGGAGGGIYLTCQALAGSGATLSAEGGNASTQLSRGGGGGGGRIAVWRVPALQTAATGTWSIVVAGGVASRSGDPGSVYWGSVAAAVPPTITNERPANVVLTSADLVGNVVSTGTLASGAWVFWGTTPGGTSLVSSTWEHTNKFSQTIDSGLISTNVGLSSNRVYYYRFYATNGGGTAWADPVEIFTTGELGIEASDPNGGEDGPDTATFNLYRPSWATNGPATVRYSMSGTASNGLDYALLGGSASMAPGDSNVLVTVTPLPDGFVTEGSESVIMTLTGSAYVIGPMNVATASIADAAVDPTNTNTASGVWTDAGVWSSGHKPVDGQNVIIANDLLLPEASANLATVVITNATLTFTNWSTCIKATELFIRDGVVLTLPAPFAGNQMSNRVWLAASNITIDAGARIDVDGLGFRYQQGPGAGTFDDGNGFGGGGAYGGKGGAGNPIASNPGGTTYGSAAAPFAPGSGGGGYKLGRPAGGDGGGAVLIQATNRVTLDGTITANGENGTGGSGGSAGSGGGVYIACREFVSAGGLINANGGNNTTHGGSGGGRISIAYDTGAQAILNLVARPDVKLVAKDGRWNVSTPSVNPGRPGTIQVPDTGFFPDTNLYGGQVIVPGLAVWSPEAIVASDGLAVFDGIGLAPSNNLRLESGGELEVIDASLTIGNDLNIDGGILWYFGSDTNPSRIDVGNNLNVTNAGEFYLYAGMTNGTRTNGVHVSVTNAMTISGGGWVYPVSDPVNGGSPIFTVRDLTIADSSSGFDADERGFGAVQPQGYGPGGGTCYSGGWAGGGGHGGAGADGSTGVGGGTNDSREMPSLPGSGAGRTDNMGGGLVRVTASHTMTLNGVITANGRSFPAADGSGGGGGAGGGIYLYCAWLNGTNATLSATGGNARTASYGGGGGGGRIAVWRVPEFMEADTNLWTISVDGGTAFTSGQPGTVYFGETPWHFGTVILLR